METLGVVNWPTWLSSGTVPDFNIAGGMKNNHGKTHTELKILGASKRFVSRDEALAVKRSSHTVDRHGSNGFVNSSFEVSCHRGNSPQDRTGKDDDVGSGGHVSRYLIDCGR